MAYTKEQAREYYLNYTKKGLKKGRKGVAAKTISKAQKALCTDESKAVRAQISAEKKAFMKQYRAKVKALVDSIRDEMKKRLEDMPKGPEKDALKAEYQERIKAIQEMKSKQTEQFNAHFKQKKEQAVNDVRAKYGLQPLKSSSDAEQNVKLSKEQNNAISNAFKEITKSDEEKKKK